MATRLICTECGTGNFMFETGTAVDLIACTNCYQSLSIARDIVPYADGRTLVWDGPFLAAVER